jgi:hypothetical protein
MDWIQLEQCLIAGLYNGLLTSQEGLKNKSAGEDQQQLTRPSDQDGLYFIITPVCQVLRNTVSDNVERCISIQIYFKRAWTRVDQTWASFDSL